MVAIVTESDAVTTRITITRKQLAMLEEVLSVNVDLDVIELDNNEPETAAFVRDFIHAARGLLDA